MTRSLTSQQNDAIGDDHEVLQIVACAGSGKTEVLARRVARALASGADPGSLIAFTFTTKAAGELKDRIETRTRELGAWGEAVPPTARGLFVGTIHAYCLDLLRRLGGRYESFDVVPEEREWALALRYARRLGIIDAYAAHCERSGTKVASARAVESFLDSLDLVEAERLPRDEMRRLAPLLTAIVERYQALLEQMQLFSFGTVIETACRLLEPGQPLARNLAGKVSHVFVDEYQDLNRAQDTLVLRLRALGAAITAVGDDDQAIYQWRGGDVALFVDFGRRFPGAQVRWLDRNHRSRPRIARTAALLARGIAGRLPKEMRPARKGDEAAVELVCARDPEHEAELVAKRVQALVRAGYRPGDVAILLRSIRTSGAPFRHALRARGIDCRSGGKLSLLSRPETRLLTRILVLWAGGVWWPEREGDGDA